MRIESSRCILIVLFSINLLSTHAFAFDFIGQVISITDGDSIKVMHNGQAESVRLVGIDCPEKGQAFSQRAKKEISILAFGQKVTVHPVDIDRYGRTVATVVLPSGKNLNHELVKAGWCMWFRKYAPNDTILENLENEAKQVKRGLWSDPKPIPPWEYRKKQYQRNPTSSVASSRDSKDQTFNHIIGNQDSRLYHRPDCPSYGQIADENRVAFASSSEAEAAGYRLARNCP